MQDRRASDQEILERRARDLAQPVEAEDADGLHVLAFTVAQQRYVVPLADVVEVVPGPSVARVPHAPEAVVGTTAVRGTLLAVFDLHPTVAASGRAAWLVVLGRGRDQLGIVVDEVRGTEHVDDREFGAPGPADMPGSFVRALHPDGIALLDLDAVLASERFNVDNRPAPRSDLG